MSVKQRAQWANSVFFACEQWWDFVDWTWISNGFDAKYGSNRYGERVLWYYGITRLWDHNFMHSLCEVMLSVRTTLVEKVQWISIGLSSWTWINGLGYWGCSSLVHWVPWLLAKGHRTRRLDETVIWQHQKESDRDIAVFFAGREKNCTKQMSALLFTTNGEGFWQDTILSTFFLLDIYPRSSQVELKRTTSSA
jgi:hypothetical protein